LTCPKAEQTDPMQSCLVSASGEPSGGDPFTVLGLER
jgi:hypothetical protein